MRCPILGLTTLVLSLVIAAPVAAAEPSGPPTTATWTPAPAGPQVFWDATAFAPTTCQLVSFGGTGAPQR